MLIWLNAISNSPWHQLWKSQMETIKREWLINLRWFNAWQLLTTEDACMRMTVEYESVVNNGEPAYHFILSHRWLTWPLLSNATWISNVATHRHIHLIFPWAVSKDFFPINIWSKFLSDYETKNLLFVQIFQSFSSLVCLHWPHSFTDCILSGKPTEATIININCYTNQSWTSKKTNAPR